MAKFSASVIRTSSGFRSRATPRELWLAPPRVQLPIASFYHSLSALTALDIAGWKFQNRKLALICNSIRHGGAKFFRP
jgi:hypothetical protein